MIVKRETTFEINLQELDSPTGALDKALELVQPWLDEMEKDGVAYTNLKFETTNDPGVSLWIVKVRATVDVWVEEK